MFSPADGGFCGARSCYSDLRLPAALYIENFTIFYHAMQAESYFLFFQKSPPIRNYRQLPDHFVSSPLPLLRCCSVFFLLFFSGFTIFVKNVRCALFPRKLPSLHGIGTFQHGCSKDAIAAGWVVDQHMGHRADQAAVLYNGAATHALHNAARCPQKFRVSNA